MVGSKFAIEYGITPSMLSRMGFSCQSEAGNSAKLPMGSMGEKAVISAWYRSGCVKEAGEAGVVMFGVFVDLVEDLVEDLEGGPFGAGGPSFERYKEGRPFGKQEL